MVSVGIHPSDEQIALYNELKIEKKHRYLVFNLNKERNAILTAQVGERDKTLKDLEEFLTKTLDCYYVIYDFEYQTFENPPRDTSKLIMINYAPDNAPIKTKVPFTSTRADIKASFVGIQKDIQTSDNSLLDHEELRKECCN